jgi:hypothetical protein
MSESIIEKLAGLAYDDALEMTKRLYERQERLEDALRVLVADKHRRHSHVSERWEDCYMGVCTRIREMLGDHVDPE